jgi:dTDP-4-dehydrorhamnose reductase
MKILVTGANGMVARAAIAHCQSVRDAVIALTHRELDISDREKVFKKFGENSPEIVFNCGAYTDVDGAETNEEEAYAANAAGPENLALAAKECGAVFVTISTDYVFGGQKGGFYTEEDQPEPQSVYARSKYEGERRCAAANPDSIVVRSGWIYGHHGSNFLSVVGDLLSKGGEVAAIDDCFGTPTFASDLAARMRELAATKAQGVFHAANFGAGVSYFEFAAAVAASLGIDPRVIKRVSHKDLKRPAPRPVNSRLRCLRSVTYGLPPMRDWMAALDEFLTKKGST